MSDTTKTISIVGKYTGLHGKGMKRRTTGRGKKMVVSGGTQIVILKDNDAHSSSIPVGYQSPVANHIQTTPLIEAYPPKNYNGGKSEIKQIKVELKKTKKHKGVMLIPSINRPYNKIQKIHNYGADTLKRHTRKNRKITIGISSLHKRVTRAKHINDKIKEMPIHNLKTILVKNGLIKETSKAPDSVIRQIATDSQIIGEKGL